MAFSSKALAAVLFLGTQAAVAQNDPLHQELTPTGRLRVAVAYAPSASALYVIKDAAAPAGFRGVSVDLGSALAKKLGVSVEFVPYLASGEITEAAH
jgi:polar amino acid transport system substrate-binding protein